MNVPTEDFLLDLYEQWQGGRSKNDIERVEFNDPLSHGKGITKMWRAIGLETEKPHRMAVENQSLREENARLQLVIESMGG